jgi:hypothetical protein
VLSTLDGIVKLADRMRVASFHKRVSESLRGNSLVARETRRRSGSRSRSRSPVRQDARSPRSRSPPHNHGGHDIWRPTPSTPAAQFEIKGVARSYKPSLRERITKITPQISLADRQQSPLREAERSRHQEARQCTPDSMNSDPTAQNGRRELRDMPALQDDGRGRSMSPAKSRHAGAKRPASAAFQNDEHTVEGVNEAHARDSGNGPLERTLERTLTNGEPSATASVAPLSEPQNQKPTEHNTSTADKGPQPATKRQKMTPDTQIAATTSTTELRVPPAELAAKSVAQTQNLPEAGLLRKSTAQISNNPNASKILTNDDGPVLEEPLMAPWHRKSPVLPQIQMTASKASSESTKATASNAPGSLQAQETSLVNAAQPIPRAMSVEHKETDDKDTLRDPPDVLSKVVPDVASNSSATKAESKEEIPSSLQSADITSPPLSRYDQVLAEVMALTQQQQHEELSVLLFRMSALHDAMSRHPR